MEQADVLCGGWYWVREGTWSRATFQRYGRWLGGVVRAEVVRGARCACPKTAATCQALLQGAAARGTVVRVPGSDPTTNAAERALRHAGQWRKTSYGTDSAAGSHVVENVLTVVATGPHHERNALAYLTRCCQALYAETPPPSLLPQTAS